MKYYNHFSTIILLICLFASFCAFSTALNLDFQLINPKITTDDFVSSAYGNGVAVAFTNNALYVSDSTLSSFKDQTPTNLQLGAKSPPVWQDTCYWTEMDLFFAVGTYVSGSGQNTLLVITSPDAKNWTVSSKFTLQAVPRLACGTTEVFLSTGLSILQTSDAKTWTQKTPVLALDHMYYVPSLNYYVGWLTDVQTIFQSVDGKILWNPHIGPPQMPYTGLAYGNGVFVVAGAGVVYWSANLAGWSVSALATQANQAFGGLTFDTQAKMFIITLTNSTGIYFYRSTNGNTWTVSSTVIQSTNTINTMLGQLPKSIGGFGSDGLIVASQNQGQSFSPLSGNFWSNIVWLVQVNSSEWIGPARSFSFGNKYADLLLFNGQSWKVYKQNVTLQLLSFSETPLVLGDPSNNNNGSYVAHDGVFIYVSSDLINWNVTFDSHYYNLGAIDRLELLPSNKGLLLTGSGQYSDDIFTSPDGYSWTRVKTNTQEPYTIDSFAELEIVGNTFLSIWSNWLVLSTNGGQTWRNSSVVMPTNGNDIWLQNNNLILYIGFNFSVASTNNLMSWRSVQNNFTLSNNAIFTVFQKDFVIMDFPASIVYMSSNGLSWTNASLPSFTQGVTNVGISDSELIGIGSNGLTISISA